MAANNKDLASDRTQKTVLSVLLAIVCIIWVLPVIAVIVNSFASFAQDEGRHRQSARPVGLKRARRL